ncbi:MAG: hypothetical protein WDN44_01235 [Sphingomonas sp.]
MRRRAAPARHRARAERRRAGQGLCGPPASSRTVDHAVVYRNEKQFCAWPYTRGFWNFGDGELVQSFDSVPTDYASADAINHNNMIDAKHKVGDDFTKKLTVRSKDWGRTWDGANRS